MSNICSICGKHYKGYGNNAQPINDGRCCNYCNSTLVVPKRIQEYEAKLTFGQKIKKIRMLYGLTMQNFAKMIGVTKSCVNMWENANVIPREDVLLRLSKVLDVSIDYLLGNERTTKNETLEYIQRNLEKLDNQKLQKVKKVLQIIFEDLFIKEGEI